MNAYRAIKICLLSAEAGLTLSNTKVLKGRVVLTYLRRFPRIFNLLRIFVAAKFPKTNAGVKLGHIFPKTVMALLSVLGLCFVAFRLLTRWAMRTQSPSLLTLELLIHFPERRHRLFCTSPLNKFKHYITDGNRLATNQLTLLLVRSLGYPPILTFCSRTSI